MDDKERYQTLIEAFSAPAFQQEINQYRYEIESELKKFIYWATTELDPYHRIYYSPESRIKSKASFEEKICRKDYLHEWTACGDTRAIQDEILAKLCDLIGFRITCLFMDSEGSIYNKLKEYHEQERFTDIRLNFEEGTIQKNGHRLYKVSGTYQNKVCFELQIKASVHNLWGEVEHKTLYKGSQYAVDLEQRQTITSEIFRILKASDRQLISLFTHQYTETDLVCGLFAEKTKHNVEKSANTPYLAGHYKSFFDIFLTAGQKDIWRYVSNTLAEIPYERHAPRKGQADAAIQHLAEDIKATFLGYYLKVQYAISQELYIFHDLDDFIFYLAEVAKSHILEDEDIDGIENDAFAEEEGPDGPEAVHMELMNWLKSKLPDALKERN